MSVADVVRATFLPAVRAEIRLGATTIPDIPVAAGAVSVSASRTGRRVGDLELPFRPDVWELVRNYQVATVDITTGYVMPNHTETVSRLATLEVRRVSVTRPDDTIHLTLGDASLRVAEQPFTADQALADTSVSAFIGRMLTETALPYALTVAQDAAMPAGQEVSAGDDRWQTVEDVCDQTGLECFTARDGNLVLRAQPELDPAGPAVALLDVGPSGVVEQSMSDFDREAFANAAVVVATWVDDTDVPHRVEGWAYNVDPADPSRWDGPAGRKVWVDPRTGPLTTAQCQQIAATVLYRRAGAGRGVRITTPAMWQLEPGDVVDVRLPAGDEQRQQVQTVTWDLSEHTSTVETRTPETANIVSAPAGRT